DEQHQNHAGERDDHFLADGGVIKRGESSHEANTVVFFNLAFNQDRAEAADKMSAGRTGGQPSFRYLHWRAEHRFSSLCGQRSFTPLSRETAPVASKRCAQAASCVPLPAWRLVS